MCSPQDMMCLQHTYGCPFHHSCWLLGQISFPPLEQQGSRQMKLLISWTSGHTFPILFKRSLLKVDLILQVPLYPMNRNPSSEGTPLMTNMCICPVFIMYVCVVFLKKVIILYTDCELWGCEHVKYQCYATIPLSNLIAWPNHKSCCWRAHPETLRDIKEYTKEECLQTRGISKAR